MKTQTIEILNENHLAGCREVQRLLSQAGIVSVFYAAGGDGEFVCSQDVSEHPQCDLWPECQRRLAEQWTPRDEEAEAGGESSVCPRGHLCLQIELKRKRQSMGFLICCLKNLRYRKTESLERLCSRLQIDAQTVVELGLREAIDADGFYQMLHQFVPDYIEKAQENADQRQEIEAVTESLSQRYEEINLLHRITDGMKLTRSPAHFFDELCEEIRMVSESEKIMIFWRDSEQDPTDPRVISSGSGEPLDETAISLLWRRTQHESQTTAGILLDNHADQSATHSWPGDVQSIVSVPIRRNDDFLGAVAAINKRGGAGFDSIDTKLLISVANELGVYLENFRLYGDLQDLLIGSLRALTSSIDAKDPYTCGHSERVAVISHWLAEKMGLSADEAHTIYLAGLLHDVGKIGVSELVLQKPGRLLPEEFEQIKQHPQIGSNILSGIRQMAEVSRTVLTHHERFDGKGYPMGLQGEQIPLAGRIVKLADSFDAMISNRVYRAALPVIAALAEIRLYSGTQFDPDVAAVLLQGDLEGLMERLRHIGTTRAVFAKKPLEVLG